MPLDPLIEAFLDQLKAQPTPDLWDIGPIEARAKFSALMQFIGPKDVPIGKVENILMPGPAGEIAARIYSPVAMGADGQPTLVYFHGGGFVLGDLDTHDGLCRLIANEGWLRVIAVDYRLAPEHRFPAAVEDSYAALCWIEQNAAQYGVDPNRLAVGGDSAGGNLAAVMTQMAKAEGGPKLGFQLLLFPMTHYGADTPSLHDCATGYFLEKKTLDWFSTHYVPSDGDHGDWRASPLQGADLAGLPPAYVMLAGYDPLHDEGVHYVDKLRAAGIEVTLADFPDLVHDFIYMQSVLPQAHEALAQAAKAVEAGLGQ